MQIVQHPEPIPTTCHGTLPTETHYMSSETAEQKRTGADVGPDSCQVLAHLGGHRVVRSQGALPECPLVKQAMNERTRETLEKLRSRITVGGA